jgi:deoxycytidylate deaminase
LIIQAGIKQIFYSNDKHSEEENVIAAKKMLKDASVKFTLISAPKITIEK